MEGNQKRLVRFFSRMRSLFLGMEGGSISGAMFGVVGRP